MPGASGWPLSASGSSGGATSARPSTRSMSSRGRPPGRSSIGASKQPTMVDSTPTATASAVDDQVDSPREVALHMGRRGRRDMARQIGRWRHHRPAEGAQDGQRHRVGGNPDRDGVEPGGGELGDRAIRRFRQHQRQRPRPERLGERGRLGIKTGNPPGGREIADMGDQRIEGGPALGLIKPGDRGGVGGVRPEAIDGLGRERDQPALGRGSGRPAATAASPAGQIRVFRSKFTGIATLNSASCGMRNPRL